ncbi:MAG TPA: UvrD-helicase domain-containing protein, partial [bacterium]|nr:UvrD-helicase domain-containing protein [bacterium]
MPCEITFVSAPAGSGKTQRLANAYIALLKRGVEPGRILAITFTEKAAAEMKERILSLLKTNDPPLYRQLLERILEMRVSTIDSFCLSLIRRSAPLIDLSADLEVTTDDRYLREEAFQEALQEIRPRAGRTDEETGRLLEMVTEGRFRGWQAFAERIHYLFEKIHLTSREVYYTPINELLDELGRYSRELVDHPAGPRIFTNYQDLFPPAWTEAAAAQVAGCLRTEQFKLLTEKGEWRKQAPPGSGLKKGAYQNWLEQFKPLARAAWQLESYRRAGELLNIFRSRFLEAYRKKKWAADLLDFTDLPLLAHQLLTRHPEALNILYAFDEQTDHILIDEFQDTNFLQWGVFEALSEEWFSGASWRNPDQPTSLFMVGDEKQAIYYFRDANSEVFRSIPEELRRREPSFRQETLKHNYRSRAAIIEFTNHLFSQIMTGDPGSGFRVGYLPLEQARTTKTPGRVELTLLESGPDQENREEVRGREAELASRRILSLVGEFQVSEKDETLRPARFRDFALLLRERTHLKIFEAGFKKHAIPYTVVKGSGFYQAEEVCLLRSLAAFLADPGDGLALYTLLSSRLFRFQPGEFLRLYDQPGSGWWPKLCAAPEEKARTAVRILEAALARRGRLPVGRLFEEFLLDAEAWRCFPLDPEQVNLKKFLAQLDQFSEQGLSLSEINERLDRLSSDPREARANVLTEDLDAVQVITVHSAKGLEFPIVILPGLDQPFGNKRKEPDLLAMERDPKTFTLAEEPESRLRQFHPLFLENREKELEEERHLFYVAVTRARDALFLSGLRTEKTGEKEKSPLDWIAGALDLDNPPPLPGFRVAGASMILAELETAGPPSPEKAGPPPAAGPDLSAPLPAPQPTSRPATDYLEEFRAVSGQARQLGTVIHQLLNEI